MAQKALCLTLALAAITGACNSSKSEDKDSVADLPNKEIRDLSYAIKGASSYREDMRSKLDAIELDLFESTSDEQRWDAALRLSRQFRSINTDSAIFYAYKAKALSESLAPVCATKADIALMNGLSTAGLFTEALDLLNSLETTPLDSDTKLEFWVAARRLYSYMRSYAHGDNLCYKKYNQLYQEYDDSLLLYLPTGSDLKTFLKSERLVTEKRFFEAQKDLETLMANLPQEDNLYGMAAFQMAEVWRNLGNENRYASFLALSALSDVKGCVSEGLALPTLADWLYRKGEINEAFSFINFALEEASAGNARMRAVTLARFVPIIDQAYRDKINSSRDELMVYVVLVTVLLLVTAILIVFLFKQIKKSKANAIKLSQTSRRQESYIANFIGLYSGYADRLNHLAKLVSTKLASGQSAELKKLIDSGRFTDQDNDDIHKIFDSAFLDIYPDFINNINALLRPEEAIVVKGNDILTPELRIYAFVKLGIDESTRIAQILHYSINTVYTYRNKMRNKAIRRESFDSDVKML